METAAKGVSFNASVYSGNANANAERPGVVVPIKRRPPTPAEWAVRVPSPFPLIVDQNATTTRGRLARNPTKMIDIDKVNDPQVLTQTVQENVRAWLEQLQTPKVGPAFKMATVESERRVPPPPPPRGVTLHHRNASNHGNPSVNNNYSNAYPVSVYRPVPHPSMNHSSDSIHYRSTEKMDHHHHHRVNYLETQFAYSVNGILGTAAQASAAAAFFARAAQKLNLASPHRRKRHGSAEEEAPSTPHPFATDFCGLLRRNPPLPPAQLLRRLGTRENPGVGKVRVMLRIASSTDETCSGSNPFLTVDKKRKQITLQEPTSSNVANSDTHPPEDRRVGVSAPKMFAFDGLFMQDEPQNDISAAVLSDIVTAVINGSDGCVFCFGHAKLGKTYTMVGNCDCSSTVGLIPTAIAWLFRGISEQKSKTGARFSVRVSAVEVAGPNETLRDLLAPHATESEQSPGVYLRDDPLLGTQLQNQSELRAPTLEKAAFYLDAALAARSESDSRYSHLLYTLHVYQYSVDRTGRGGVAGGRSRLHLLDLGSCDRSRAAAVNSTNSPLTLSALGNVLVALFNGQRHLPHREHKITQVLRECLGSLTCQAALVAHVAATSCYSETLSTVQMASRIHRMRRRRIKQYTGASSGGSGSGGSSEESRLGLSCSRSSGEDSSASADPSSSEQSCDTVIYVGPIDDATDGEHPPVYLPSLNSGDNRCSMSKALRGSTVEDGESSRKPISTGSPAKNATTVAKRDEPKAAKPTSAKSNSISRSPQVQRKLRNELNPVSASAIANKVGSKTSDEQWIDGPRIHKSRMTEVRNLVRHQRETWVDGPPTSQVTTSTANPPPGMTAAAAAAAALSYGFMDEHKQGMIRQWVETQTAQVQRQIRTNGEVWIDAKPTPVTEPATQMKVLTVFKTCENEEETSTNCPVPRVVPPATVKAIPPPIAPKPNVLPKITEEKRKSLKLEQSPLAEEPMNKPLEEITPTTSEQSNPTLEELYSQCEQLAESLSQESEDLSNTSDDIVEQIQEQTVTEQTVVSCEPWRRMTHETIQEEEEEEEEGNDHDVEEETEDNSSASGQVPSRSGDYSPEYIEVEEPDEPVPMQDSCLQVTEEDIALSMMAIEAKCETSSLSGSDEHPLRVLSQENLTVISHFTSETFSQGTASDWDSISTHYGNVFDPSTNQSEFFKNQLEHLARLHQLYHPSGTGGLHHTPLSALSTSQIGSFKDLPLLSQGWNNTPSTAVPAQVRSKGQETRKALVSTIGVELERELGLKDSEQTTKNLHPHGTLSSLRHPDGASNPHLDKHPSAGRVYETGFTSETEKRMPGNGASTSDPEEEPKKIVHTYSDMKEAVSIPTCSAERTIPGKSDGESDDRYTHKTPKLSRFFGSSKKRSKSPSISKRNTSTMSGSPTLSKATMTGSKYSPKPEKRSSSKSRDIKHSPSKSTSKSPSRNEAQHCVPASPKSRSSANKSTKSDKDKLKNSSSSSHRSPKKDSKLNWQPESKSSSSSKRDVKSYGFSYESCHQTVGSSLCPSEGYESGGSDSGVHISAASPIKNRRHGTHSHVVSCEVRRHLMPIGEMSRKNFSSGTSTSGSGGSGGSGGHYESSGYESVMRDSECSSLGSSQDSDRDAPLENNKQAVVIGQSSSCTIL